MNADGLAKAIDKLVYEWQVDGLILDSNSTRVSKMSEGRSLISWNNKGGVLKDNVFSSYGEYFNLLKNSQYTMMLYDGALFQISYVMKRDVIIGHRLCWYPCPISIPNTESLSIDEFYEQIFALITTAHEELEELLTSSGNNMPEVIRLDGLYSKSPLRIDFMIMPDESKNAHPDVHLHVCEENCRIPVKAPLCLRGFMTFVAENFYPNIMKKDYLFKGLKSWGNSDMLTKFHKNKWHLNII